MAMATRIQFGQVRFDLLTHTFIRLSLSLSLSMSTESTEACGEHASRGVATFANPKGQSVKVLFNIHPPSLLQEPMDCLNAILKNTRRVPVLFEVAHADKKTNQCVLESIAALARIKGYGTLVTQPVLQNGLYHNVIVLASVDEIPDTPPIQLAADMPYLIPASVVRQQIERQRYKDVASAGLVGYAVADIAIGGAIWLLKKFAK